ncbi:hypothetical protein Pint_19101 [Pistacia integerrima]|uniref:Uncharacterized protein n=1 Tax=Pistacia integerrima TaxID=434235 RepID=A0ACC0YU07_9ROSI|nr:hypothetical protein Pint_19101 [Pistacia integerrima]
MVKNIIAPPFYSKQLNFSDVTNKLAVETSHLEDFPPFPHDQHFQNLKFSDEEYNNTEWNFRLAVRQTGPHKKPTIGGNWIKFFKMRGLREGNVILSYKERDEAMQKL